MNRDVLRRGRGWRPKTWRGRLGMVALLLGLAAWVVVTSPIFSIDELRVTGNERLTRGEIIRLAGAEPGRNLLTLSLDEVERSLLSSPWVASVEAVRDLPSTLELRVGERRAVATVTDPGGEALVAEDGVVLGRAEELQRLVSIAEVEAPLDPGDLVEGLEVPLRVAGAMSPRLHQAVSRIRVDGGEVLLSLRGGGRILLGRPADLAAKAAAAASMLRYADREDIDIEYIDVRAPSAPALKPAAA